MFIVKRSEENPILSPRKEHPWESFAAFNWCPVKDGRGVTVVYRALTEKQLLEEPKINKSIIGRAQSKDGVHYTDRLPFITPTKDFDKYGCEDPRVTKIDDIFYIFYTALGTYPFSAEGIKVAVALSKDLKTVTEKHLVTPFNAKAMALFPQKINDEFVVIFTMNTDKPPSTIAIARCKKIEDLWSKDFWDLWLKNMDSNTIDFRRADDDQIELGAPPVKTKDGWLIIYSHIRHYGKENVSFGVEAVLLDKNNPRMIVGRTKGAFLVPEVYYEKTGIVSNIVFPSGAMVRDEFLDIYYGASDTHSCIATIKLEDLLSSMKENSEQKKDNSERMVERFAGNPIIVERPGKDWEAHGVFNPAAIDLDGKVHIFYRAMGADDTSTFGYANSKNGFVIDEREDKPAYVPRMDFEKKSHPGNSGCEDPRLVQIGSDIYMTYTAYDGHMPRVAVTQISEKNFLTKKWAKWSEPIIVTPPDVDNKDACIFPEKTEAGYVFLHRVHDSICAYILNSLDFNKEKVISCIEIIYPRKGMWDERKVGISSPPIKTKKGWLLLYHGVSETGTYRVGAVLLDLNDPTTIISRTAMPIFEPVEDYEMKGVVPKVVFPCGLVKRGDKLFMYYGGGDKVVGVATMKLSSILKILSND